jgi:hypothetical protein
MACVKKINLEITKATGATEQPNDKVTKHYTREK